MKHWKAMSLKHKLTLSDSGLADASVLTVVRTSQTSSSHSVLFLCAEKEYGFKCNGGIALPCEVDLFEEVLKFLVKDEKKYGSLEVSEFLKLIREMEFDLFSCKESPRDQSFMPLLLKS
ncbi:hypothetical protein QYF36_022646 [Acer negundo]|nr:hypothetical protein QYF36_022646 [Acer negundo]